jgi:hypothetical protein
MRREIAFGLVGYLIGAVIIRVARLTKRRYPNVYPTEIYLPKTVAG